MNLTNSYSWMRRDFRFDATCEHCGHEEKGISGYDDSNFYDNVIPNIECRECGESSRTKKSEEVILNHSPRYDENVVM